MKNPPSHSGATKTSSRREPEIAVHGIWSGTISFSLVAIPVQLVKAVQPSRVSFRLLHSKDYSPLARKMYCPADETMVPPEEIIRGYEIGPDKYILVTEEELDSVSPERSRTIEIIEFIDLGEVDAVYYDQPYYLIPAKGGEKAYRLLVEVMARTNKAGLAKFVLRDREYLVAVKSMGEALGLTALHYHDEILSEDDIKPAETRVEAAEKSRLKKSIEKMMADFHPEHYAHQRRDQIMALLKKKAKKEAQVEAPHLEAEAGEGPADLIAALEESMRQVKKSR
jgi:DNA end-binding protein Ku